MYRGMPEDVREQILFALEDDNEVMTSALDSDLDEANKEMNRRLINKHNRIISKIERKEILNKTELQLIRDANEMDLNDEGNARGHHEAGVKLEKWIKERVRI